MRALNPDNHSPAILLILTLFAIVGPVSIDIFSPSLPAITEFFGTTNAVSQWSIGIFMLGFSCSMLIVGPIADRFGRKKTLIGGYTLFLLATLVALNTTNIYTFIGARFVQAVFGCFGTAVARMIARDYYSDKMEVRMLSYISACLTVAPMVAPIAGGFIQEYVGWRANFVVMAALAIIAMAALTLIPERSTQNNNATDGFFSGYKEVLTDAHYMRFTIAAGAAFAGAFVFVAGGPFVMIDQLGIAPKYYGFLFAVAIAGYLFSATFGPKLNDKVGREKSDYDRLGSTCSGNISFFWYRLYHRWHIRYRLHGRYRDLRTGSGDLYAIVSGSCDRTHDKTRWHSIWPDFLY